MTYSQTASDGFDYAWKEPQCLIESSKDDQLEVNQETLSMLQKITDSVVVVGIVGLYRTGKSYLMNRLAGQPHGQSLCALILIFMHVAYMCMYMNVCMYVCMYV